MYRGSNSKIRHFLFFPLEHMEAFTNLWKIQVILIEFKSCHQLIDSDLTFNKWEITQRDQVYFLLLFKFTAVSPWNKCDWKCPLPAPMWSSTKTARHLGDLMCHCWLPWWISSAAEALLLTQKNKSFGWLNSTESLTKKICSFHECSRALLWMNRIHRFIIHLIYMYKTY